MNRIYLIILFIATVASSALAQPRPTPENRERWKSELRNYKHDFMVRELDLSRDQQSKFFPLYDQMEDSIEQINTDTRELEKRIGDDASDIETEAFSNKRAAKVSSNSNTSTHSKPYLRHDSC